MKRWTMTPRRALALDALDRIDAAYDLDVQERALRAVVLPSRTQGHRIRAAARALLAVASLRAAVLWDVVENPGSLGTNDGGALEVDSRERLEQAARDLLGACESPT